MTYGALFTGYAVAAVVLLGIARWRTREWPTGTAEGGWPLLRVLGLLAGVMVIGQLFRAGLLIPSSPDHRLRARMGNQFLIFAPVFVAAMLAARHGTAYSRRVAFMPTDRVWFRLSVGLGAAAIALVAHQLIAGRVHALGATMAQLSRSENLSHAVQILGEDLAITMLCASFLRHVRARTACIATGLLFALGHVPELLEEGAALSEVARLVADGVLTAAVLALVFRVRDVWLLWPVHVAMDLTQFLGATP